MVHSLRAFLYEPGTLRRLFSPLQVMQIRTTVTLEGEEFEPLLIELLSKGLNRQITRDEIKSMQIQFSDGVPSKLTATLDLRPAQ